MVLSEQQKKDLIERLKKGREQAKEKKLNEATTQEKTKSKSKSKPEPEPEPIKKSNSKKIQVDENESSSDTEDSVQVPDVVPNVKKESKKTQSVPLEKAFDEMKLKSKPIDIPVKKEKPYLKIKLYKEPSNPNLINKFVNSINETDEPEPVIKHKEAEPKKSIEPEKSEREKHLERLCKLYFN